MQLPRHEIFRPRTLLALGGGVALAALALVDPASWLVLAAIAAVAGVLASTVYRGLRVSRLELAVSLGTGILLPALFLLVLAAVGGSDTASVLKAELVPRRIDTFAIAGYALWAVVGIVIVLTAADRTAARRAAAESPPVGAGFRRLAQLLALLCIAVLAARVAWLISVASVPTDLSVWSEAPFLVNMLKLRAGSELYGAMADANSYSYSPGVELLHYLVLRPFELELSLGAHRVLVIACQALSTLVLSLALWPRLKAKLTSMLGGLALPALVAPLGCAVSSSFLAPHVHPDHALMLCFALASWLVLREPETRWRLWAVLAVLPALATVFKLTGAGIGLGLVLAFAWERRVDALLALAVGALLALATIPLFDASLGQFSEYAIRLQASHELEWSRALAIPASPPGRLLLFALVALGVLRRFGGSSETWKGCVRVLWLTLGFAVLSLLAYAKQGGRPNSLLPLTIGASVISILALGERGLPRQSTAGAHPAVTPAFAACLLFVALTACFPRAPLAGPSRQGLWAIQDRATRWVQDEVAAGRRPLLALGTAAWIAAGRRDVPKDQLSSASEMFFGHRPELEAFRTRLLGRHYDGIFFPASAVFSNPLLIELRPELERSYRVVEPVGAGFPQSNEGYVIIAPKK